MRGRGEKGRGYQGACIKDPWTNQRGVGLRMGGEGQWGKGEQWRGNGDNCT